MQGQGKDGLSFAARITFSGVQTIATDMVVGILRGFLSLGYTTLHPVLHFKSQVFESFFLLPSAMPHSANCTCLGLTR